MAQETISLPKPPGPLVLGHSQSFLPANGSRSPSSKLASFEHNTVVIGIGIIYIYQGV